MQDLTKANNPVRRQFIALFCSATCEDESAENARTLICECLKLCNNSKELLSRVLQTRFIDDGTPLLWMICNIKAKANVLSPLFKELLDHCAPNLLAKTIDELELGCCVQNSHALHQLLLLHPLVRPSLPLFFEPPFADPTVTVNPDMDFTPTYSRSDTCVSFAIPNFLDRMLLSRSIVLPFLARGIPSRPFFS